jgi:hypothetical protein
MKKLILMLMLLVTLATTVNAATWECTESRYHDEVILRIEMDYKLPSVAKILVSGHTYKGRAKIDGLDRRVDFSNDNRRYTYSLIVHPDGYTSYYDFTNVKFGVTTKPVGAYYCKMK